MGCAVSTAEIKYTVDGSTPTVYSSSYYTPFLLTSTHTVKAKAFLNGMESETTTSNIDIYRWATLESSGFDSLYDICLDSLGNLYVYGGNTGTSYSVEKWNGAAWTTVGAADSASNAGIIADSSNNLFRSSGYIYEWTGSVWELINPVYAMYQCYLAADRIGNLYAARYNSTLSKYVVYKWNGSLWSTLEADVLGGNYSMAVDSDNNVYFSDYYIRKWTGSDWVTIESEANYNTRYFAPDENGNLFSLAYDYTGYTGWLVKQWNGDAWSTIGGNVSSNANGIVVDSNNTIYVSNSMSPYLQKWTGSTWESVPVSQSYVPYSATKMVADKNGAIYLYSNMDRRIMSHTRAPIAPTY